MQELAGKVAFITGGVSGLGLGLAHVLTDAGMRVAVTYMQSSHRDEAMAQFKGREEQFHTIKMDVSDRNAVAAAVDEAERVVGPIQVLCNNAAVSMFCSVDQTTFEDWDWILGVNLLGAINTLGYVLPRMKARNAGGHIVNIASMSAFLPGPETGAYTTSKFALRGLSESLRYALAPHGIGVSLFCPGFIRSDIHRARRNRPESLSSTPAALAESMASQYWQGLQRLGMDPREAGKFVLDGILRNDFYIFSHTEFREALRRQFEDVLCMFPDIPPNHQRLSIVDSRAQSLRNLCDGLARNRE